MMIQSATVSPAEGDQCTNQCQHRKEEAQAEESGNKDPRLFILRNGALLIELSGSDIQHLSILLLFVVILENSGGEITLKSP